MTSPVHAILSPQQTAAALPYGLLAREIEALLQDASVLVPPRIVQALHLSLIHI